MSENLIRLKKNAVELIVLPDIGGRIVSLTIDGSKNILNSDNALWNDTEKPELNAFSDFKAYNGHTIWIGPQSDWWLFQDENKKRKADASQWPPDPYLIYSEYTVISQTASSIVMESLASPYSHIKLLKEIAINDDGSIFINVTLTNTADKPMQWDIWFNTRMDGYSKAYVPILNEEACKVEHVLNNQSQEMPYTCTDGYFSYTAEQPEKNFNERSSKTFVYPDKPYIAGFTEETLLLIRFEKHQQNEIHPGQGLVEIYNHTEHDKNNALLELEYHSPYTKLASGESFSAWEVWNVYKYSGDCSKEQHLKFLESLS